MQLDSKLPKVGTTIFSVMTALANECQALNLSQGFPDFDGPELLLERVRYYLSNGHNQYAPMTGTPQLREQIAIKVLDLYDCKLNPETEITVTSGATEALFCALTAVIRSGDEVIVFDPAYDSYEPGVTLSGGVTRHIQMRAPGFHIDWDEVRSTINNRTRMIILNTPHNPTGTTWSENDIQALRQVIEGRDIYLLADEVYEHIIFDGISHQSLCRYPDLFARSFVVSSFGKTYHTTGWKIGYCVAPAALTSELRKVHQFVTFTSHTPTQLALADFLADKPEHHKELAGFYQQKRDLFVSSLANSKFTIQPATGTYFQLLDYSQLFEEKDAELAIRLTREAKIASIPISVFCEAPFDQFYLRFCFAKGDATLKKAAEILCSL